MDSVWSVWEICTITLAPRMISYFHLDGGCGGRGARREQRLLAASSYYFLPSRDANAGGDASAVKEKELLKHTQI